MYIHMFMCFLGSLGSLAPCRSPCAGRRRRSRRYQGVLGKSQVSFKGLLQTGYRYRYSA